MVDRLISTHSGEIMTDWNGIIAEALKELQADSVFTRGAVLHGKVREIARRSNLDFDRYLKGNQPKVLSRSPEG